MMDKKMERSNKEKILRKLAKLLAPAGFSRSKPTFFTRVNMPIIEFIHLHKFTFDSSFRVHLGIRVINDPFVAVALNGPDSDSYRGSIGSASARYDFQYGEEEQSLDSCARCVAKFSIDIAEPWFDSCRDFGALISGPESPLDVEAQAALRNALEGAVEQRHVATTQELLNAP